MVSNTCLPTDSGTEVQQGHGGLDAAGVPAQGCAQSRCQCYNDPGMQASLADTLNFVNLERQQLPVQQQRLSRLLARDAERA